MPATKPRKTIFDSSEFTGPDYWTKSTVIAKSPAKSPAILAARSIVAGDVSNARAIINAHPIYRAGFTVPEMRAIRGACALAKHKYGCDLSAFEFMW